MPAPRRKRAKIVRYLYTRELRARLKCHQYFDDTETESTVFLERCVALLLEPSKQRTLPQCYDKSWHHTMMHIAQTLRAASAGHAKALENIQQRRYAAGVPRRQARPTSGNKSRSTPAYAMGRLTRPNRQRRQQSRVHRCTLHPLLLPTDRRFRASYCLLPPPPSFP